MYYHDLTPCSYFGPELADRLVAVGWLDDEHPYSQSAVSEQFVDKLFELLVEPWSPSYFMGFEECLFCGLRSYSMTFNGKTIDVGNLNLFVPGRGFLYVLPSLVVHYILAHQYAPPQAFQDAVMHCPPMKSNEYDRAIVANGPQRYAEIVTKKYLTSG